MDWTEELLKYQRFQKIEKGIADRFIEKITVYSKDYVEIVFWFGDLFEKELVFYKMLDQEPLIFNAVAFLHFFFSSLERRR